MVHSLVVRHYKILPYRSWVTVQMQQMLRLYSVIFLVLVSTLVVLALDSVIQVQMLCIISQQR